MINRQMRRKKIILCKIPLNKESAFAVSALIKIQVNNDRTTPKVLALGL